MSRGEALGARLRRVNRVALLVAMGLLAIGMIAASFAIGLLNLVDASRAQAKVVGENLGAALLFGDRKGADDVLLSLQFAPGIQAAALRDNEGRPFSSWNRDPSPTGRSPLHRPAPIDDDFTALTVREPIHAGGTVVGQLALRIDLTALFLRTALLAAVTAVTLLLSLFVSELWIRRLNASILRPLHALSSLMRQISAGSDLGLRAGESNIAEIQELGQGFNAMLAAIGERDERLARLAFSDSLTGLANREAFQRLLSQE
ncbi:MAG: CHASE sensor domain-containing protein, partial [Steroidobacteraceae bacterium]